MWRRYIHMASYGYSPGHIESFRRFRDPEAICVHGFLKTTSSRPVQRRFLYSSFFLPFDHLTFTKKMESVTIIFRLLLVNIRNLCILRGLGWRVQTSTKPTSSLKFKFLRFCMVRFRLFPSFYERIVFFDLLFKLQPFSVPSYVQSDNIVSIRFFLMLLRLKPWIPDI